MFTPFVPAPFFGEVSYGYGWFIGEHLNRQIIGHEGKISGFCAHIERYLNDRVTIIVLSNQENSDVFTIATLIAQLVFGEK